MDAKKGVQGAREDRLHTSIRKFYVNSRDKKSQWAGETVGGGILWWYTEQKNTVGRAKFYARLDSQHLPGEERK